MGKLLPLSHIITANLYTLKEADAKRSQQKALVKSKQQEEAEGS